MSKFLANHLSDIASAVATIIPIMGLMVWSHRVLLTDIRKAHGRIDDVDKKIDHASVRIDKIFVVLKGMFHRDLSK